MHTTPAYRTRTCFLISVFLLSFSSLTFGQEQSQYDKGTPPQHAAGISSLGSYSSTELGSVNLSNGALNFNIPLATIGGRGFSIPLTLNYSSKVWSASFDTVLDNQSQPFQAAYADYTQGDSYSDVFQRVGPGWSVGAAPIIFNRIVLINKLPPGSPNAGCYTHIVPKLTVMLPDRGEIEFRDDIYDGAPLPINCGGVPASRGKRWHATDGSGTIYISDIDNAGAERFGDFSGVVITADGTRYRFDGPRCTSITDRNGNQINITYTASPQKVEYKDQLGRITKIESFVADPDNPSVTLALLVTVPGYTGNHYIKLKRTAMRDSYRSDIATPSAVCTGTYDPLSKGYSTWCPGSSPVILFPHSYGELLQQIDDKQVVTEVILPDQRSLRFKYNLFGEVAEAQLPTGGKLWYEYDEGTTPAGNSNPWEIGGDFHTEVGEVDRTVIQRQIFDGSTPLATWNYFYTASDAFVTAVSPAGETLLNQRHYFKPSGRYTDHLGGQGFHDGTYYNLWSTGLEWRTETRNADGTVVLSAVEKDWSQRAPVSWSNYQQQQPANDNRVNQQRGYLETGMMSKVETLYDQYNNPTEVKEYDFDQTLKRRTVTSYVSSNIGFNYQTDDSIHLLSLPEIQTVYDGAGNQRAQTVTEYDVYVNDTNHADLISYSSVSQHDSGYSASKKTRGNSTRVGSWLNTTASYIYTYPRYDFLGNVVAVKDARGNVSSISFADDFGDGSNPGTPSQNPATPTYALPTLITSPPPASGAAAHTARSQYNYATGQLTGFRDRNNVVTQTIYNDPFDRPTQVIAALGISNVQNRTVMYYAPAVTPFGVTLTNNDVLTARDQTLFADSELRSWTVTDGFGRTKESWSGDPQGDVKVITTYDALGRTKQVSNPFRPSPGQTPEYSTTVYDLLGRLKTLSTPDGATVTTSYDANNVTVTDQAGKARKSVTDALGRLIEVYEDPNGVNFQTKYTYDVLDNLVKVEQGSQQRFFMYDSLKRLIRADNPEQETLSAVSINDPVTGHPDWSAKYEYDNNGNLTFKTDARGVVTENRYDALNRLTTVLYRINGLPDPNTGDIEYAYDNVTNGKGRLWVTYRWGAKPSHTAVGEYDAMGRVKQFWNLFGDGQGGWSTGYGVSRNYNLAGAVIAQTYPSGRTVNYAYDTAGRTTSFTGNLGDGVTRSYASSFLYNARSQVTQELFGTQTPLYRKLQYNIRGQLWDVRVSTNNDVNGSRNRGGFQLFYEGNLGYGTSGPDNNGNVLFANTYTPEDEQGSHWAIHRQSYAYDSLNRLKSVSESFANYVHQDPEPQSVQTYDYDRWGNRTIKADQTWGTGINNTAFVVDTARNRLYSPGDLALNLPEVDRRIRYDKAGNQVKDTYTGYGIATFDGDNHIVAIQDKFGSSSTYTYNANAQRVRRRINNQETWQIYGIDGELVAEYAANSPVSAAQKEYGYRDGQLLITGEGAVTQNVSWTNAVGVSVDGNSLTKTAATGWGNAGATSAQSITTGDGYTELTVPDTTTHRFVGLSNGNSNSDYTDVDFAIHPVIGGTIFIYEGGVSRGTFGSYTAGDVLRVGVEGGVVKYRKNGALLYTSTIAPTYPLLVDSALHGTGNTLSNVVISGAALNNAQSVSWANAVGVTVNGNSLTKTSATGWGNAGATSAQSITTGDGYVELTVPDTTTHRFLGLSNGNSNADYTDVDFAIHPVIGGTIFIYEGGVSRGTFGSYTAGDKLRVGVEGGVVKYRKNGALLYTSSITPTYPLLLDSALHGTGDTLSNVVISGAALNNAQSVSWTNAVGVSVNGNSLTKSAATGWGNAGATSKQSLTTGDGYVELTVPDATTHRFVGLSNGNNNADYTDVDFAIHPVIGGTIFIYEGGVSRGTFGSYTAGDVLRVGVEGGVVKYRKNGALLYTSSITPTYPLLVDCALHGTGDTLSNVVINSGAGGARVQWLVPDHLGTPRIILDQTGAFANVKRHDYLPFGEELPAGTGGRTPAMGYALGDNVRQQFTEKERDFETGLDYLLARYYSSNQGRFTSPDEFSGGPDELFNFADNASRNPTLYADPTNPQSLNKYQYTYNNPLNMTDADGHCPHCVSETHRDASAGVVMGVLNTLIDMNNIMADFKVGGAKHVERHRPSNRTQAAAMVVTEDLLLFGGLCCGRAQVGGVVIADAETTAAVSARAATTNEAAIAAANEAQSLGRSSGSAGAGTSTSGRTFTATSGKTPLNPSVQKILNNIPQGSRSAYHGYCCEPKILSQMLDANINPKDAIFSVVRIRKPGDPNHLTTLEPCSTCRLMLDAINKQ